MARPGDELDNPLTGQRIVFRATAAETGGELLEVEALWRPSSIPPAHHHHPSQDERFEIRDGELRARIAGELRVLREGEVLEVPAGTPHAMWNEGPAEARAIWQTRPALRTEDFFEAVWGLAAAGGADEQGRPPKLAGAAILWRHRNEFRLARPPWRLQAAALLPLALIARLSGRDARG